MSRVFLTISLLIVLASPALGTKTLELVTYPSVQTDPGTVEFRIAVEPNPNNVHLCIGFENLDTGSERSSCFDLDGDRAPKRYNIRYGSLEGGNYTGFAALFRSPNREKVFNRVESKFIVVDGEITPRAGS